MSSTFDIELKRNGNNYAETVDALVRRFPEGDVQIGFLGYTDMLLPDAVWMDFLGGDISLLEERPNAQKIADIHRRSDVSRVPTHKSWLYAKYNGRVKRTVFDFTRYEGTEVCHDFNDPIPEDYSNLFDIVLDFGFSEHIFDYAQCLRNILKITRVGGLIHHCVPLCLPNHGFYGLNPTVFQDFYSDNGCHVETMHLFAIGRDENGAPAMVKTKSVPRQERFVIGDIFENPALWRAEWHISATVKKVEARHVSINPIQSKYRTKSDWM